MSESTEMARLFKEAVLSIIKQKEIDDFIKNKEEEKHQKEIDKSFTSGFWLGFILGSFPIAFMGILLYLQGFLHFG